jgi:3-methyladenine DNA glycosylase AlkD
VTDLAAVIAATLEPARDPRRAAPMAAYMRHQFPFLGIPSPERRRLVRAARAGRPRPGAAELLDTADALWERDEREYQQVAVDLLCGGGALLPASALGRVERLITTRSWWDTVDALAVHVVGGLVRRHPPLVATMDDWIDDPDIWLARTAVLHQNAWKAATDRDRLFGYCLRRAADTEFFLRKAIGWALREYSKTDPGAVRSFVATHHDELSGLTRREALKRLERDVRSR